MATPDNAELARRTSVNEDDIRNLYRTINDLASDMKVMAEATKTMQLTLKESRRSSGQTIELLHEHALQLQDNRMAVKAVTSKVDEMGDVKTALHELDKRITKNEGVTTLVKRWIVRMILSTAGVAATVLVTLLDKF